MTTTKSYDYYKNWIDKLKDQKDIEYQPQKLVSFVESLNREIEKQAAEIEFFQKNYNDVYITIENGVGKNYKNIYWGRMLLKNNIGVYNAVHVMPYVIYTDQYAVSNYKVHSTHDVSKDDLIDNKTYNIHKKEFNGFQFVLVTDIIIKAGQKCPYNVCETCEGKTYCNGFVKKSVSYGPGIVFRNGEMVLNSICYSHKIPSDAYEIDTDGFVAAKKEAIDFLNEYVKNLYSIQNQKIERELLPRRIDDVEEFINTYCKRMELFGKEYKAIHNDYNRENVSALFMIIASSTILVALIILILNYKDACLDMCNWILMIWEIILAFYAIFKSKHSVSKNHEPSIIHKSEVVLEEYGADLSNNSTLQLLIDVVDKKIASDEGILSVIGFALPIITTSLFDKFELGFGWSLFYVLSYIVIVWIVLYLAKNMIFGVIIFKKHKQYRILIETCQKRIWKN